MSCDVLGEIKEKEKLILEYANSFSGSPCYQQIVIFLDNISDARRDIANINGQLRKWGKDCLKYAENLEIKVKDLELAIDDRNWVIREKDDIIEKLEKEISNAD